MQENTATVLHVGQILHLLNENVMEGASIIIFILFYDIIFFYCFSKLKLFTRNDSRICVYKLLIAACFGKYTTIKR